MVAKIATGEIEEEPKAAAGGYSNSPTATCAVDRHVVDILRYSLLICDSPEKPGSAFSALAASGQICMLIKVGQETAYCRKCRSYG